MVPEAQKVLEVVNYFYPQLGEVLFDLDHKAHAGKDLFQLDAHEFLGRIRPEDEGELVLAGLAHIKEIADLQSSQNALRIEELELELFGMGPADLLMQIPELLLVRMSFHEAEKEYPVIDVEYHMLPGGEHFCMGIDLLVLGELKEHLMFAEELQRLSHQLARRYAQVFLHLLEQACRLLVQGYGNSFR